MRSIASAFIIATLAMFGAVHALRSCEKDCSNANYTPLCAIINGIDVNLTSICQYKNLQKCAWEDKQHNRGFNIVGLAHKGHCTHPTIANCHMECEEDSGPVCAMVNGQLTTYANLCAYSSAYRCTMVKGDMSTLSNMYLLAMGKCKKVNLV